MELVVGSEEKCESACLCVELAWRAWFEVDGVVHFLSFSLCFVCFFYFFCSASCRSW